MYRRLTSTTWSRPKATTYVSFLFHPASYVSGASQAASHGSACTQRPSAAEYTSVHTWSVQSRTHRASYPSARQHSVKQLAHSPQRPRRVSSSLPGSLYRGKRVVPPQSAHVYVSTRPAPAAASAGVGCAPPPPCVFALPQWSHGGLFTHLKKSFLNQRSSWRASSSRSSASGAGLAAARSVSVSSGITASAFACRSARSYSRVCWRPDWSERSSSSWPAGLDAGGVGGGGAARSLSMKKVESLMRDKSASSVSAPALRPTIFCFSGSTPVRRWSSARRCGTPFEASISSLCVVDLWRQVRRSMEVLLCSARVLS